LRVCVYTAIYGGYDPLREQAAQSVPTDFVCFTDSADLTVSPPWIVVHNQDRQALHPRMRAKYFKILSHQVFPNGTLDRTIVAPALHEDKYDYLIWVDGSVQIKSPTFVEKIISHIPERGWTMLRHPDRDCIYDEAGASLREHPTKYGHLPIVEQVESYRSEGYPEHNGLMANTIIGRASNDRDLDTINDLWWHENLRWTYQDQLSLPYVLWKLKKTYVPIDIYLWHNEYFSWRRHDRPD
jgi:hypothetical protein